MTGVVVPELPRVTLAGHPLNLTGLRGRAVLGVLPGVWITQFHETLLEVGTQDLTDALASDRYRMIWVTGPYLVGAATGMAMTSFFSTRFGLKNTFIGAMVLFGLASALSAFAGSAEAMSPSRLAAGFGTGLAICAGMLVLWREFPRDGELAMTLYALGVFIAPIAGFIVGGLLLASLGDWRIAFWVALPTAALAAVLARVLLPGDAPPRGAPRPPFDLFGLTVFTAFVVTMIPTLRFAHYWGWFDSPVFTVWATGWFLSSVAFIGWGLLARAPLIDLRPLGVRNFGVGLAVKALLATELFALLQLVAGYSVTLRRYQWWQAALIALPALLTASAAMFAGARWGRDDTRKARIFLGALVASLATWRVAGLDLFESKFVTAAWLGVWGAGFGLSIGPTMLTIFHGLPPAVQANAAGVFNILRGLPVFMATMLLGVFLTWATDYEFDTLRQTVHAEEPIVRATLERQRAHARSVGARTTTAATDGRLMLARWTHRNARASALEDTLLALALLSASALLIVPLLRPPRDAAPDDSAADAAE